MRDSIGLPCNVVCSCEFGPKSASQCFPQSIEFPFTSLMRIENPKAQLNPKVDKGDSNPDSAEQRRVNERIGLDFCVRRQAFDLPPPSPIWDSTTLFCFHKFGTFFYALTACTCLCSRLVIAPLASQPSPAPLLHYPNGGWGKEPLPRTGAARGALTIIAVAFLGR